MSASTPAAVRADRTSPPPSATGRTRAGRCRAGRARTEPASANATNFLGGGQAGCNWQSGTLVYGLEGDFDYFHSNPQFINGTDTLTDGVTPFTVTQSLTTNYLRHGASAPRRRGRPQSRSTSRAARPSPRRATRRATRTAARPRRAPAPRPARNRSSVGLSAPAGNTPGPTTGRSARISVRELPDHQRARRHHRRRRRQPIRSTGRRISSSRPPAPA